MTDASGTSASTVHVGTHGEVVADRAFWYLTRWTDPATLPQRPGGGRVRLARVVNDNGSPDLVELMVARWLGRRAPYWAWFDRWWGKRWRQGLYEEPDAAPTSPPDWVADRLQPVIERRDTWDGVWDAVAAWPDGRIVFAEAKRRGKDRLGPGQHAFASAAKEILGPTVSFTVVEWTAAAPLDWREVGHDSEQEYRAQRGGYLSDAEYVSRWYRWTECGQRFDEWLRSNMPVSGDAWLADHHLRRPPQHDRFFASLMRLRAELEPDE